MRHRRIILVFILCIVLVSGIYLFYNLVIIAKKTVSPNKGYMATYNRLTQTITLKSLDEGVVVWRLSGHDPALLWSPDSKLLAVSNTVSVVGHRAEIYDIEHSNSMVFSGKTAMQIMLGQTPTTDTDDNRIGTEITKWIDNDNVEVKFFLPLDSMGQTAAGQYIFEISSCTIKEMSLAE